MPTPLESRPVRFSRRQAALRQAVIDAEPVVLIPDISEWREVDAAFDRKSLTIEGARRDDSVLIESPTFTLPRGSTVYFSLFVEMKAPCGLRLSLRSSFVTEAERAVHGSGEIALSFRYTSNRGGKFNLILAGYQSGAAVQVKTRLVRLMVRAVSNSNTVPSAENIQSCLPHWTKWQRSVHYLCGRSRWLNAAVATWEMHLGCEEVLSLPQYMAICPTGQCNASCGFCSVTTNRTGIIKKQLPFDSLDRFLSPIVGSLRLFGLEGNGEPSLYDRFDELLLRVTSRGAAAYLISNGERLSVDQIALLLASSTDAINFSLNAATAETHRRVMKLKGWDAVVQNISRFVRWRGDASEPLISVSIVVTRDNVHEVQQFLHFAEWQLKVDRILIRPLSEIANDSGVIEDLRELVPYESQINDMLDAVAEYLEFVPRRAEIVIDPSTFNAFRQEPYGVIVSPPGFDNQLLAPRSTDWLVESGEILTRWCLNRLEISASSPRTPLLGRTRFISVPAGRQMTFRCRAFTRKGALEIVIVDESGNSLGAATSDREKAGPADTLTIEFSAPATGAVYIELRGHGPAVESVVDFGQMYSWPVAEAKKIMLPHSSRWQVDMPGTTVRWKGSELVLEAQARPSLYLYRSYKVPTLCNESITLNFKVSLERGALGIGILSDDGSEWLVSARYESEAGGTEIIFNTGRHGGFQVVIYALTEEKLIARIDWGNNLGAPPVHKSRLIEPRQLLLPKSTHWIVDTHDAGVQWCDSSVRISWNGAKALYLLRSPRFPCPQLRSAMPKVCLLATVKKGRLGIGFLGGQSETFTNLSFFAEGEHNATIDIDTYGQKELMVVLFSDSSEPLEATVDWGRSLNLDIREARNEWRGGLFDPRSAEREPSSEKGVGLRPHEPESNDSDEAGKKEPVLGTLLKPHSIPARVMKIYMRAGFAGVVRKAMGFLARHAASRSPASVLRLSFKRLSGMAFNALLKIRFPKPRIYCQKPWTDLNNFTVDGRMDVCCITTGPSQERYALGNIFKQNFQEIWNGARMREFRRTVNDKDKLPPCARCPMANNYRPPF